MCCPLSVRIVAGKQGGLGWHLKCVFPSLNVNVRWPEPANAMWSVKLIAKIPVVATIARIINAVFVFIVLLVLKGEIYMSYGVLF